MGELISKDKEAFLFYSIITGLRVCNDWFLYFYVIKGTAKPQTFPFLLKSIYV